MTVDWWIAFVGAPAAVLAMAIGLTLSSRRRRGHEQTSEPVVAKHTKA